MAQRGLCRGVDVVELVGGQLLRPGPLARERQAGLSDRAMRSLRPLCRLESPMMKDANRRGVINRYRDHGVRYRARRLELRAAGALPVALSPRTAIWKLLPGPAVAVLLLP